MPPFSFLKAAPYSAIIKANGIKNVTAEIMYQGIAPYPIRKNDLGMFANPNTEVKIISINDTSVNFLELSLLRSERNSLKWLAEFSLSRFRCLTKIDFVKLANTVNYHKIN